MDEFSLENIAEKIHFGKTKSYFKEVLSSYQNYNYRSSVVMLWSVAVCDLIYKLQGLVDLYADTKAKTILDDLTKMQNNDLKSSLWEIKLVEYTFEKTDIINSLEYENLRYLQQQRHLSAHPILDDNRELYSPNKETVRSLLRNTLEGLLIKPPFYTQQIFKELIEDIAENYQALNTKNKLKKYIESRYLSRLTPKVELLIFRSLWKLIFKLDNEECEKNRKINLQAIEIISERNKSILEDEINNDKDYYSNIASSGKALEFLAYYLSIYNNLFDHLSEDAQLKIKHCIETTSISRTVGWYVKENLQLHYDDLLEWIEGADNPTFEEGQSWHLLKLADTDEWQENFCKLMSAYYGSSLSFNQADTRFSNELQMYLKYFNISALKFLLEKIERNNQTYRRSRANIDHVKIKERIDEVSGEDFDTTPYRHFSNSILDDDA